MTEQDPEPKEEQTVTEATSPAPADEQTGEVVPLRGVLDRVHSQLERAAQFAMTNPGTPGVDEFLSLAMQARILAASPLCPAALRGDPHAVFHVGMIGRSMGLSIDAAVELIDVIPSSNGARPSLSPQLVNAQCRRLGLGSIVPVERTASRCVAMAVGPRGVDKRCVHPPVEGVEISHVDDCACDVIGYSEFTWEMAQDGRLVLPGCKPREHSDACKSSNGSRCNNGYITYPRRMLWWRAAGFAADDHMPEALLGLYSPEELGAVVDAEGRPIDPATVELPPGFEDKREAEKLREAARNAPGDADVLLDLQLRVAALPDEMRAELADRWVNIEKLRGVRLATLPNDRVQLVTSILRGVETKANKVEGWVAAEQLAAKRTELARGAVFVLSEGRCAVADVDPEPPGERDGDETAETQDEASQPVSDDEGVPGEVETDEQRADRARQVAADAGLQPASTLLDPPPADVVRAADLIEAGAVEVNETHVYPLDAPAKVDPDDSSIAERTNEAQVLVVIEYVKALDMTAVNKGLRAHEIKLQGAPDNVRRQRLTLAILREIERQSASDD